MLCTQGDVCSLPLCSHAPVPPFSPQEFEVAVKNDSLEMEAAGAAPISGGGAPDSKNSDTNQVNMTPDPT